MADGKMSNESSWDSKTRKQKCMGSFFRSKPIDHDGQLDSPLNRNMSQFDILMYGIGAMLGNSIYGVIAVVVRKYTGPSAFICFMMAGIVALLNGMCYSELSAHIPRAGSAYAYSYVIAGEFAAFTVGWLMLLEYALSACSAAVLASYNIDILSNSTISNGIIEYVGALAPEGHTGMLNRYPNFIAMGICILAMLILSFGNRSTSNVNIVLCFVTLIIIGIATGYMYAHFHKKLITGDKKHGYFLPMGIGGLLSGSGIAFNAFIGFDGISVAGEEAKNPRRTIPVAILSAVSIVLVVCVVHSIAFVGYKAWWLVDPELGLADLFFHPDVTWLRILVCIGATLAAGTNVICCTYAIPRIAYSMASDGLLHWWMGWVHPVVKVPLIPLYIFGAITTVLAVFINYASLVSFLSVGTLISYVFVSCDLIILRYMKADLYLMKDSDEVGFLRGPFRRLKLLHNKNPGRNVLIALLIFVILSIALVVTALNTAKLISGGEYWILAFIIPMLLGLIGCAVFICMHKPYKSPEKGSDRFEVPCVPIVPLAGVFFNIALIINLPVLTWARVGIWLFIGYLIYFIHGMWHSKLIPNKYQSPDEYSEIPGDNNSLDQKPYKVDEIEDIELTTPYTKLNGSQGP